MAGDRGQRRNVLEKQNVWLRLVDFVVLPAKTLSKKQLAFPSPSNLSRTHILGLDLSHRTRPYLGDAH